MSEERFYVREHGGFKITPGRQSGHAKWTRTWYIMDRLYNCAVVETFERTFGANLRIDAVVQRQAEARCAELNEAWRQELARGVVA